MHFVLQTPSLQHLAGVKIVAASWNERDIMTQIRQTCNSVPTHDLEEKEAPRWKELEEKVNGNVWALPLPETIKKELLRFVPPLGREIIDWCKYHSGRYYYLLLGNFLPQHFCWTMRGTVDYAKMAEIIVKDERLSIERRYEIACINCLEDEIGELFSLLPEERRREYSNDEASLYWNMQHRILIAYFTCTLSGDADRLNSLIRTTTRRYSPDYSIDQCFFKVVLSRGSRATGEYFWKKLDRRKKDEVLKEHEPPTLCYKWSPTCGFIYYLSLLNAAQQRRLFQRDASNFLIPLLCWPMQSLFAETAERAYQFTDSADCTLVLRAIIHKIKDGSTDFDYSQLLHKCWRLTPAEHKQVYIRHYGGLDNFLESKEEEFIVLFLNEAYADRIFQCSHRFYKMDESVISDAALIECKERAALESSNDKENEEKRLRSQYLNQLVDSVIDERNKLKFDNSI